MNNYRRPRLLYSQWWTGNKDIITSGLRCILVVNEEVYFHVRLLKILRVSEHYYHA